MVEWLEWLGYTCSAENRRKVVSSRLGFAMRQLENFPCQPSSTWVPFSNYGRLRQQKDSDGLSLSSAVPKIQWDSNPHCLYGYKAVGSRYTFIFTNPVVTARENNMSHRKRKGIVSFSVLRGSVMVLCNFHCRESY